jgi:peptidoglycan/LPS O-acetylase OafA/YrhL
VLHVRLEVIGEDAPRLRPIADHPHNSGSMTLGPIGTLGTRPCSMPVQLVVVDVDRWPKWAQRLWALGIIAVIIGVIIVVPSVGNGAPVWVAITVLVAGPLIVLAIALHQLRKRR